MPQADGSQRAIQIMIFAEVQRGTGEGHRPWDRPNTTMTNATVDTTVAGVDGQVIMVKYRDGEKKVDRSARGRDPRLRRRQQGRAQAGRQHQDRARDEEAGRQLRGGAGQCRPRRHRAVPASAPRDLVAAAPRRVRAPSRAPARRDRLPSKSGSSAGAAMRGGLRRPRARAVDVLIVRALDRIGARKRFDRWRVLGQARKQRRQIIDPAATTWMTPDSCCSSPLTAT